MAKPLTGYNPRRTKGPRPDHVAHARASVMELATNEAARMQREAMRPGVDPVERERILAEAEATVREAARWVEALGAPGYDPGHLVTDLADRDGAAYPTVFPADSMPAGSWALGHDGEGCVHPQPVLHLPARRAEEMLDRILAGPELTEERAKDRLAWAAACILGQRDAPDSEMIRSAILALEDAVISRVTQDAAGIVTWARKEAPAAFGRLIDMSKYSSSMHTKMNATLNVMAMAGLQPTQKLEVTHKHELIDRMTRDEQDRYARTGEWPARLLTVETTAQRRE